MRRVLLCGKSLFISGLQASLESRPGLELHMVDTQPDCIPELVKNWEPDILILETELIKGVLPLTLLQEFPDLRLIELDIENNRLLVFSRSTAYEPTTEQLLQVIDG